MKGFLRATFWALLLVALARAGTAAADDANRALLTRPIDYTDVADAFEPGHAVDVNLQLGYRRDMASGTIERETADSTAQDGQTTRHHVDVAKSVRVRNELALRLDVGVFHDVMVFARLPIVLSDDNELRPADGVACTPPVASTGCSALQEPIGSAMQPQPGAQSLFDLSHNLISARRSGVPHFDFGAAWAVINQYRTRQLPTWVLVITGSADTGKVMQACLDGHTCNPGVSRGTAKLELESRWSYRYRFFEPFFGLSHAFEWIAGGESAYHPAGKLDGIVDDGPPQVTQGTLGTAFLPWEDRARFQRFELDLQGSAAFIGAGRDFSPLFDALGSSQNPQLTAPSYDRTGAGRHAVPFTGVTNVEEHARLGLDMRLALQAARYVRFAFGFGLSYLTSHLITGAPACDTSVQASAGDPRSTGCSAGIADPVQRPAIDTPGRRFRLEGDVTVRLALAAMGQF
ncbi:MAG: hypothetical protein ACHQ53_04620 [Polyangiales bacterium]